MLKKIMVGCVALGVGLSASAGLYQPKSHVCKGENVFVPCEGPAIDIGGEALYFVEQDGDLQFLQGRSADTGWGFRLEGSYHFGKGKDATLNWAHYDETTSAPVTRADVGVLAQGTINFKSRFDIVNLEFAQQVDFGERWDFRLHAGIQYANLLNQTTAAQGILNAALPSDASIKVNGVGPRVGTTVSFYLDEGLSIFGGAAVSVLSANEKVAVRGPGGAGTGISSATVGERNAMVTATDIKLGVKYSRLLSKGDLSVQAGWESQNFMNACLGVANMAWDGGFFGLKWVG